MYFRCQSSQEVRSYTPPKCLVSSIFMAFMYSPLINLISTKSQMIILRPYSDDFTHNSLCPQKVLGAGKSVSMPLCKAFVYSWKSCTICLMKLRLSFGSLEILTVVIYPAIFSVPELAWNPPPNKYPKQRGSYRRNHFSCSCKKS